MTPSIGRGLDRCVPGTAMREFATGVHCMKASRQSDLLPPFDRNRSDTGSSCPRITGVTESDASPSSRAKSSAQLRAALP